MYETWSKIREKYPDKMVVMVEAKFADSFHMELLGGEVFCVAENQKDIYDKIPNDGRDYVCRFTGEEEEDGVLKSSQW